MKAATFNKKPPEFFKPLLWSFNWQKIDIGKDKEDIIVNAVNEGRLDHWRWLIKTYGKEEIRQVLEKRLESEFHPESRNLAKIIFSIPHFRPRRIGRKYPCLQSGSRSN